MKKLLVSMVAVLFLVCAADAAQPKISLDRLNWTQSLPEGANITMQDGLLAGVGGITFNGTAPTVTTNTLYSNSGALEWDGLPAANNNLAYDVMIVEAADSKIYAYNRSGAVIASDTSAPYDLGAVGDAVMAVLGTGKKIVLDGSFDYTTPFTLLNYTEIEGMGDTSISTASDVAAFDTAHDTYVKRDIYIRHLNIYYTATDYMSDFQVLLYNPLECTIEDCTITCPNVKSYSASHASGIGLLGYHSYTWLNTIRDCTLNHVYMLKITDSRIEDTAVNTYGKGQYAIVLDGVCNNVKLFGNEIVCDKSGGVWIDDGCWYLNFKGNFFEPHMNTPTTGNNEEGIIAHTGVYRSSFEGNVFCELNGAAFDFKGNYNLIEGNIFNDLNRQDDSWDDIWIQVGYTNAIVNNIGTRSDGAGTGKGYLASYPDYNIAFGNLATGDLYSDVLLEGGVNCLSDNNMHWTGAP